MDAYAFGAQAAHVLAALVDKAAFGTKIEHAVMHRGRAWAPALHRIEDNGEVPERERRVAIS
jgi:hypothetical protein